MNNLPIKLLLPNNPDIIENKICILDFTYLYNNICEVYDLTMTVLFYKETAFNVSKNEYLNHLKQKENTMQYKLKFSNISSFFIKPFSGLLFVDGFEINDHKEDGWASSIRYEICDFEESIIGFFCEQIDICSQS